MRQKFARVAAAVAIAAGGVLATTASANAAEVQLRPTVAADDPCGFWRAGNWLTGYSYWYRHCGDSYVMVNIRYYDNTSESSCFSPWEKRQLSWRTTNAYYNGYLC